MKKILLYGYGGAYNHGAEAILQSSVPLFRKQGVPIFLSTHFPEQDREFGVDKLVDRLIPADFSFVQRERTALSFDEKEQFAEKIYRDALAEVDEETICIGIGGDNYCYPNWHRQSLFHRVVKERGGISILWGCSVQPEMINDRMAEVFRGHDHIYVRESLTAAVLQKIGVKSISLLPDPAFLLKPQPVSGYGNLRNACALNLSPLMLRRSEELLYDFIEVAKFLLKKVSTLFFVPHVCMSADNDMDALTALAQGMTPEERSRIVWCPERLNAAQRKYLISCCQMLICCRTHASIAGYSSGVPTLVVGYSIKSEGIGVDADMEEWVIPFEERERLLEQTMKMWDKKEEIADSLNEYYKKVKKQYESLMLRCVQRGC